MGIYHEAQRKSRGVSCGVKEEHGEEYKKEKSRYFIQTMEEIIQLIFSYNYVAMRA